MTGPVSSPDLDLDAIRADVQIVEREWGAPADCDWPPDAAVARLAAVVPSLLVLVGQLQEQLDAVRATANDWRHAGFDMEADRLDEILSGRKENHDG